MAHRHAATSARVLRACVIAVAACALGCSDGELGDAARDADGASDEGAAAASATTGTTAGAGGSQGGASGLAGGGAVGGSAASSGGASVRLDPGETKNAELVETLPVAQSEDAAERRVVLRLGPGALPDLAAGDRLLIASEAQVTTRCDVGQVAPGCDYNPDVRAQLLLTGDGDDTDPQGANSQALAAAQTQSCTHADHHCMFTFAPADTAQKVEGGLELPCIADGSCRVNLVMWAWHPDARPGGQDHVLVGGNDGNYLDNGIVEGDAARLGALRERGVLEADRTKLESSGGGTLPVGTDAEPVVVFAHRLDPKNGKLLAGTHFTFEAKLVVDVADRARFSSLVFVTKNAGEKAGNGLAAVFPKAVGEHNGINCTAGTTPCTLRKTGVFRVTEDIEGPVYLNVTARSAVPGGGTTSVKVDRGASWVRTTAYAGALGSE